MATAPTYYPTTVKNRDVVYLCDKTARYAYEVMHSASSDMSFTNEFDTARMLAYLGDIDAARLTAVVAKARNWITEYMAARQPMDLPESSPQNSPAPAGRHGV